MPTTRTRRILGSLVLSTLGKSLIVVVLCSLVVSALAAEGAYAIDWLVEQESRLRAFQFRSPVGLYTTAAVVYFIACFIPGTNGKAFIGGWLFGTFAGALLINFASALAALVMFLAARFLLRGYLEARYARYVLGVSEKVKRDGGTYLFALRMLPFLPYSLLNVVMGVAPTSHVDVLVGNAAGDVTRQHYLRLVRSQFARAARHSRQRLEATNDSATNGFFASAC